MGKVFPKVQKLTPNERCFTWYVFSFSSHVQAILVKHFVEASPLECIRDRKDWAQVPELKSTGEGSGSTRSAKFGYILPEQDAGKQSSASNCL